MRIAIIVVDKKLLVASTCGTRPGCVAIPAGLRALADALRALATAQLTKPACKGL